MFQTQAIACPAFHAPTGLRAATSLERAGRRAAAALAAATFIAGAAVLAVPSAAPRIDAAAQSILVQAGDSATLRDRAEALRATLLRMPNVAAVRIEGLRQQALVVEYAPKHLARFGITPAALAAAVPLDAARSTPGHLAVQATDDIQAVANVPVRAAGRVFRLGDVALVTRMRLDPPETSLWVGGEPAARLVVTPVK